MRIAHQELFHSRKKAEFKPNTKSVAALKEYSSHLHQHHDVVRWFWALGC